MYFSSYSQRHLSQVQHIFPCLVLGIPQGLDATAFLDGRKKKSVLAFSSVDV